MSVSAPEPLKIRELVWECRGDLREVGESRITDEHQNQFKIFKVNEDEFRIRLTEKNEKVALSTVQTFVVKFMIKIHFPKISKWLSDTFQVQNINARYRKGIKLPGFEVHSCSDSNANSTINYTTNIQTLFTASDTESNKAYCDKALDKIKEIERIPECQSIGLNNNYQCPISGEILTPKTAILLTFTIKAINFKSSPFDERKSVKKSQKGKIIKVAVSKNGISHIMAKKKGCILSECRFKGYGFEMNITADDIFKGKVEELNNSSKLIYMKSVKYRSLEKWNKTKVENTNWQYGLEFSELEAPNTDELETSETQKIAPHLET